MLDHAMTQYPAGAPGWSKLRGIPSDGELPKDSERLFSKTIGFELQSSQGRSAKKMISKLSMSVNE